MYDGAIITLGTIMILTGTSTEIPDSLVVDSLDLNYSSVTELPDGLRVIGDLYLNNSKLTKLPDGLIVGGGLDLRKTPIETLPKRLHVGGWLDLINTKITQLPNDLIVGRWLDITHTRIRELHNSVKFGELYSGTAQLDMTEETQIKLIEQHMKMFSFIKNPTKKARLLQSMLWEI